MTLLADVVNSDTAATIETVITCVVLICTFIGTLLAKFGKGTWADLGHFLLAFGVDIGKARKRTAIVSETMRREPEEVVAYCSCKHSEIVHVKQVGQCAVTDCTCEAFNAKEVA